jgi:DNA invertase Pin-like site-specific DNA recombinase
MNRIFRYCRVSTDDKGQDLTTQLHALIQAGYTGAIYFADELSGKIAPDRRPGLAALLKLAKPGDTIAITALDRLSRDTITALQLLQELHARNVAVVSLMESDLNTNTADGFFRVGIYSLLAQRERMLTSERVKLGLDNARAKGKQLGRPRSGKREHAAQLLYSGQSVEVVMSATGLSMSTVYRIKAAL